jgi:RNA polymerase sigma-70 factor (ECF subfamily)
VLRNRGSDEEDFLEATLGHADVLHALAARLAPNPHDATDLVQETYLRAYRAWGHRRPTDMRAWLATICLNAGRDQLRRGDRRSSTSLDAVIVDLADPADTADDALAIIDAARVRAALWDLPEAQRVAIALMDLCGFTAAQVATVTDTPRGTVLARVHRGRKSLALRLGDQPTTHTADEITDEPRS